MEADRKLRHQGRRWKLIYGDYSGPEAAGLNRLNAELQRFLPFTIEAIRAQDLPSLPPDSHLVIVGTRENNHLIDSLVRRGIIRLSGKPEGYSVGVVSDGEVKDRKLVIIAGEDANGVLYGVVDFCAKALPNQRLPEDGSKRRQLLDGIKPVQFGDYPRVNGRGIWTWGYVIYDYRRFFENMASLKMNTIVIWNDQPPINSRGVIAYAHGLGIKVLYGFPWGWGFDVKLNLKSDREMLKRRVLKEYRSKYLDLGLDGIYFQTVTETTEKTLEGKPLAWWATMLVNEISHEIFRISPDLNLYFGLHATSVQDNFSELRKLDKRVKIMWEDAGMLPFDYNPVVTRRQFIEASGGKKPLKMVDNAAKTLCYAKKIALVRGRRGRREFAMVAKGWTCIDWSGEFEHHEKYILGERSREFITDRLIKRQGRWDKVNAMWSVNAGYAARFYREMLKLGLPSMTVAALIEDGLFEEKIQPSVRLLAETLWNPFRSNAQILGASTADKKRTGAWQNHGDSGV